MSKVLSNRSGVKIPHQDMVLLRKGGILKLGIDDSLATAVSSNRGIGPKKTTAVVAFHLWNWVGILVFAGSIYWSFSKDWWWFIVGFFIWRIIWSANKKGNSENLLDAAMIDKEFYDRVLEMNGWLYEIDEKNDSVFENYRH